MTPNNVVPDTDRAKREGLSDDEVVIRVLAGETALFEIIMRRHNQRLYRVARAILGNDGEAEDVMQDAYVRAYACLHQYAHRAQFSTWLTKIAVHEAWARSRRQRRVESLEVLRKEEGEDMGAFASTMRDPERQTFDREMKAMLEGTIDALPESYRSVFVLREIEGLGTEETAECLGVSEEVVKTRLHRARGQLQRALYERAGASSTSAFEFHLSRCDRVVTSVLQRIRQSRAS